MLMQTSAAAAQSASAVANVRLPDLRYRRPMPDDFRSFAPGLSINALAEHYRTSEKAARRWLSDAGIEPKGSTPRGRPVPPSFMENAKTMHVTALGRHHGVSNSVISRWLKDLGIPAAPTPLTGNAVGQPVPASFVQAAPVTTIANLRDRYRVGECVIRRWLKLTDTTAKPGPRAKKRYGHPSPSLMPSVPTDVASQAAHHLRRYHTAVYSCAVLEPADRAKIPDKGVGRWYVAGKGYLTAPELIAAAQAKGFDAGAWARL